MKDRQRETQRLDVQRQVVARAGVMDLEDPRRIRGTRNVAAYFGLVPRKKESGDTNPQLGITKTGDTRLRRLLVLCAHHLLSRGKDCRLKRWGLELCKRGGSNALWDHIWW